VVRVSNPAAVGAFDSGVGGLSILSEIRRLLPAEDLIYMADSGHCPYGVKPIDSIRQRALEVTDFLVSLKVKAVVVACNSACVAGLDLVRARHPELPVIGVEPAVKPAHELTRNGKIGILATNLTLNGERFSVLVNTYGKDIEVYTQPAPGLVELVEEGKVAAPETEDLLHKYLDSLLEKEIDTLVLGCTHYPFLRNLIQKICGPEVNVLDTGLAVARQTERVLEHQDLKTLADPPGKETFYTSGDPAVVKKVIGKLWTGAPVEVFQALA
jgi:glutamate racemase